MSEEWRQNKKEINTYKGSTMFMFFIINNKYNREFSCANS